jgi:hypothetical protein
VNRDSRRVEVDRVPSETGRFAAAQPGRYEKMPEREQPVLADAVCADGVRELREVDLFEISIVPAPANEDTRLLSLTSADGDDLPSEADQRRRAARLMLTPEQERDLDQWVGVITGTKASTPARKSRAPIRIARFFVE